MHVLARRDRLRCEADEAALSAGGGGEALAAGLAEAIRDITKLRGAVEFVPPGSLPNDGKVIEDARKYD